MRKFYRVLGISLFCAGSAHALVDLTIEGQYIGGSVAGASAGGTTLNPKFSGYLIKPAIHLNYTVAMVTLGAGPTFSFPNVTTRDLGPTNISDSVSILRYGGEAYARLRITDLLQPFVRFEIGKDKITETNSSYATTSTGTVLTGQIADIKFTYGSIYYVLGAGLQSQIIPFIDAFLFAGYTFSGSSTPEVQSFTVNGAPVTNYTVNGAFSYAGYQIGLGVMLHF